MTVPGVYSPEQIAAHVDKVIASDGVDDSRAVEVMAFAIMVECFTEIPNERGPQTAARYARAALGALRALEAE